MLRLGIVGLPNVGKSTLFNALTSSKAAAAENYPFCTVEPNVGVVEVPDPRLETLNAIVKPKKKVPAVVEFVDIAGLVKGASQGEGLGNQFLSHIREVDAIVHVIRAFEDPDVVHVMGPVDPLRDHDVIMSELALSDIAVVDRRLEKTRKSAKAGDKEAQAELGVLERVMKELDSGSGARAAGEDEDTVRFLRQLGLLTAKPILYAANVSEDDLAAGGGKWVDALRQAVPKAFVVLKNGVASSAALATALQEHVKRELAPYKYPREIEFVDALPRTETGKIRRVELREREIQRKAAR